MLIGKDSDLLRAARIVRGMATLLGAVLMFLPGCSTAPTRYLNSLHPQYGQTDLDRDLYECRRENTHPVAQSSSYRLPYSAGAESDARMVVDENMARSCLAARGWHPVASNVTPTPPIPTPARQAPSAPSPDEKARFQRLARDQLAKPYLQTPPACDDGGWWATKNYIVDVAPSVEASGLRKGDRLLRFGDISLAQYDTAGEAWSKLPRGDTVMVRVDRGGKELLIQLSCRDGAQTWQAGIAFLRAIVDGQWQACIDGLQEYARLIRLTPAATLRLASECMRERAKAAGQRPSDDYWRTVHAWATKAIEESRYKPTGLTDVRTGVLDAAEALEKAGHSTWANDVKQQIATFETSSSKQ